MFVGLLRLAHGWTTAKKIGNFKVTKNKMVVEISTHLEVIFRKKLHYKWPFTNAAIILPVLPRSKF